MNTRRGVFNSAHHVGWGMIWLPFLCSNQICEWKWQQASKGLLLAACLTDKGALQKQHAAFSGTMMPSLNNRNNDSTAGREKGLAGGWKQDWEVEVYTYSNLEEKECDKSIQRLLCSVSDGARFCLWIESCAEPSSMQSLRNINQPCSIWTSTGRMHAVFRR